MSLEKIRTTLQESIDTKTALLHDEACLKKLLEVAGVLKSVLQAGHKVILCGNGGSAADSQHIAAEFIGRFEQERRPMAAISLTTDTSAITAIGNDYGYEQVFSRQLEGIGKPGDLLIGISTSGKSINILKALEMARASNIRTVVLVGHKPGGKMQSLADYVLAAPSNRTARIQECHIVMMHIICQLVESGDC